MRRRSNRNTKVEYQELAELRYQIRQFVSFSERAAREAGLEPQQHQLLLAVKGLPDDLTPTIGELANRLQIHHNSMVELVDRLEDRGLVERRRGDADRRQVLVDLTEQGEAVLDDLSRYHREELRTVGPALVRVLSSLLGEPGDESKDSE